MADWTGSNFGAIDDEMTQADEPVDALTEFKIARNLRYLYQHRGEAVSWSGWGVRRVCAAARSLQAWKRGEGYRSFMIIPWIVQPGLERVQIHVTNEPGQRDLNDTKGDIKFRARFARLEESANNVLVPGAQSLYTTEIDLTLDHPPKGQPRRDALVLEVLTEEGSKVTNNPDINQAIGPTSRVVWGGGTSSLPVRESSVFEVFALNGWRQPLCESDTGGTNYKTAQPVARQTAPKQVNIPPSSTPGDSESDEEGETSFTAIRGVSIKTEYADTTPHLDEELAYGQPYDSADSASLHAQSTQQLIGSGGTPAPPRRRCVSLAPQPVDRETTANDAWPDDHPEWWGYADSSISGNQTLAESTAFVDREAPALEVQALFVPTTEDDGVRDDYAAIEKDAVSDDWTLTITVEQLGGSSDWSGATQVGTASRTVTLDHYPTDVGPVSPHLLQEYWLENAPDASSDRSTLGWLFHEGRMWPSDFTLIQPFAEPVSLSGVDQSRPIRVTLQAEYPGSSTVRALTRVGMSVWEVP